MHWENWIVLLLALLQGGWLIFDGGRALILGNYVTPRSGPRAGQLGPWARIVSSAGCDPRGTPIKCLHLFLGIAWLTALLLFGFHPALGWWGFLFCALASLWYLPMGTFSSLIILALLFTPAMRNLP